ncbi:MlaD family protein [Amycolatopsis sp. SID8362]|uniref:MlaD family protein n=1 Tax=Amycolatopsis sp. SID8362 TaxID=2690346 RepID=UPI00136CB3E7|nr:MlaD family protein [Amycolatopsis sp. SID8362]NBH07487.1 MCE family protein [Amycolatopsis sp. SID8362]NED44183.1 MCE family protein [Amycolatopsis sp. SID8362]
MARTAGRNRRSLLIGFVVLVAFAASVGVAITAGDGLPGQPTTIVNAAFADVGALRSGDDIRIGGVRVGQVGDITLTGDQAIVQLKFDGDKHIYRNSKAVTASVGARSALGQKYVDFTPGTPDSGELGANDVIPSTKTEGAQELSDVLAMLDEPTRQALQSVLQQTGGGAAGHEKDLRDALGALPEELPDLGTVARALAKDNGTDLTAMLRAIDSLGGRFAGRRQEISDLVGQLGATLDSLAVDQGKPLEDVVDKGPDTLAKVRGALQAVRGPLADAESAMSSLQPGASALGKATPDVRSVLREGVPPLDKVPGVAWQAEPAVDALTQTFADARPLAPAVRAAVGSAHVPLEILAPYSTEIASWFSYAANALSQGDAAGHFLRIYPLFNTETLTGALGALKDPVSARNAYPAPGQARQDKKSSLLGPR